MQKDENEKIDVQDIVDPFQASEGPELFFGVVAPVGADLKLLEKSLENELKKVGYETHTVRLSDLIENIDKYDIPKTPRNERIEALMDAGTDLRETINHGAALAMLSVMSIRNYRDVKHKRPDTPLQRQAYILHQLKRPEEVDAFRDIYGRLFILISAYSPRRVRIDDLTKQIAESNSNLDLTQFEEVATHLARKDEEEEGRDFGQNVRNVYPKADLFVDLRTPQIVENEVSRFVETLFGHPFHTPRKEEIGIHLARSASLRSGDLSRQVGAVLTTPAGEIISIGCNDVPKAGGGQYWPGSDEDHRDFRIGYDSSTKYKEQIIAEIVNRIKSVGWFKSDLIEMSTDAIVQSIFSGEGKEIFEGAQFFGLLEFGRPIHAEMAAITEAARRGISLQDAIMYVTTFPCHMCARHIISSGIKKVVYVEPYQKSRVWDLYKDSVTIDEPEDVNGKVNFLPFVGMYS